MICRYAAPLLLLSSFATLASAEAPGALFAGAHAVIVAGDTSAAGAETFKAGKYHFTLDVSQTPELSQWAHTELVPAVQLWYPKLVKMLGSETFDPPKSFSIVFKKDAEGVAATSDTTIVGAAAWYDKNLQNGATGSIIHELVHVVQQYGTKSTNPGWLVEGLADYIRFYDFEPQTHGADIKPDKAGRVNYDDSYRTTANFLNWIITIEGHPHLLKQLNTAMRDGQYSDDIWERETGRTVQQLNAAWKEWLAQQTQ